MMKTCIDLNIKLCNDCQHFLANPERTYHDCAIERWKSIIKYKWDNYDLNDVENELINNIVSFLNNGENPIWITTAIILYYHHLKYIIQKAEKISLLA